MPGFGRQLGSSAFDKLEINKNFKLPPMEGISDREAYLLTGALKAAKAAHKIIMANYGLQHTANEKMGIGDIVTETDLAADNIIAEILKEIDPEADLITEETYEARVKSGQAITLDKAWIVDPIDGTTNFSHGLPYFATSIAYVENGKPVIAVIVHMPVGDVYTAVAGMGAYRNGKKLTVKQTSELRKALISNDFGEVYKTPEERYKGESNVRNVIEKLVQCVRRLGASALDGPMLAAGNIDGFWHMQTKPWDYAASMLIAKEAGATVSDKDGNDIDLKKPLFNIVGGTSRIHAQLLDLLQQFIEPKPAKN